MVILKHRGKFILIVLLNMFAMANLAEAAQQRIYTVAIDAEYAPYEFRDVDGEVKGMLPDMLRNIAKISGVRFEFISMNWPDAVDALKHGKVDILNMIRTPERVGKYEFSNPHSVITQAMFRYKTQADIEGVDSIAGKVVALQAYDIANEKLAGREDFDRVIVNSKEQGFLALDSGRVAVFFTAEQPGLYFLQEHALQNIELAKTSLWPQDFCFAAKKGNTDVIALLNEGLSKIKYSGEYAKIITRWSIKPQSWMAKHAREMLAVVVLLSLLALSLWLWVFLLRRTVQRRTDSLVHEQGLLQQSEEKYRGLLETMPGALLLIDDGVIVYANHAAMELFGMEHADKQCSFLQLVPERCTDLFKQQLEQIYSMSHAQPAVEGKLLRLDQSEFDAEVIAAPCEYQGKAAIQLIISDISERKQALVEMERLFSIIQTSSDFIGMADAKGCVIHVNAAGLRLVGLSADTDVHQLTLNSLHSDSEVKRLSTEIFPHLLKHGSYQSEVLFLHQDGDEIPTLAALSVQKNADGTPASYSIIAHDIRKDREQQQRMEHVQRLESLGVLAGGIAHDFNNILTAILGNAAIAERKAVSHPQEIPRYLSNIVESSEKAADLCKQMLAYSGKGKFVVKAINLSDMVGQITKLLEVSIVKNVVLKYELVEHLPAVEVDTAQIQQVIMNLVINASDAINNKSGVISLTTGVMYADYDYLKETCVDADVPEGRYVFVEVSDTGCGMNKQTQQRIFEPFFTTKFTGHGLGMSAVLGIVRGHHGTLKLYSEPGRGTTFKVLLPVSDREAELLEVPVEHKDQRQGSGSVLIIDDEETIRETASMMLEDMGFDILTAANGLEGVEVYRQHQDEITAVLLDMTMPKLDGQGCFRELRRINKHVKVILSSGYNEQEATSRFTGKGLAGFIQKPYLPEALADIIFMTLKD